MNELSSPNTIQPLDPFLKEKTYHHQRDAGMLVANSFGILPGKLRVQRERERGGRQQMYQG